MIVLSGHQPLYLPWLGLIHKASLCDVFVYMDDVQYSNDDFQQRNKVMTPDGRVLLLTVPITRKGSSSTRLVDLRIAEDRPHDSWQKRHLMTLRSCYGKTQFFKRYFPFFEWLFLEKTWTHLAELDYAILVQLFEWFKITAKVIRGSACGFTEKKSNLLLEHALTFKADVLLTGQYGVDYIIPDNFSTHGIRVVHQHYHHPTYEQGRVSGITHLSFVDLLFRRGDEARDIAMAGNMVREEL